jgi:hypothetical protein
VKPALTLGIALAAVAATLSSLVKAGPADREPVTAADAMPPYAILTTVRDMGFDPISRPARRGPYYVLRALDARGVEMNVVADAQLGDILSVLPARPPGFASDRGPRIIHVPQPGERGGIDERADPQANADDDTEAVRPPRQRVVAPPLPQRRSDAPSPPPPVRGGSAYMGPPADGPTPIRPTPHFKTKAEPVEKFEPPRDPPIAPSEPPPAGLRD